MILKVACLPLNQSQPDVRNVSQLFHFDGPCFDVSLLALSDKVLCCGNIRHSQSCSKEEGTSTGCPHTCKCIALRIIHLTLEQTPSAVDRVRELLKAQPTAIALKVGVKQRGCNGLTYTLEYATTKQAMDEDVIQDGARVLIDSKAQLSLLGTEMDYVKTPLSSEFVFNNPNIKGTCGCGESFNL